MSVVPCFSAPTIEMICRVLADQVSGPQITNLIAPLGKSEIADVEGGTKWKRLNNAVISAQNRQQDGRPLVRLVTEIMSPVRFASAGQYDAARSAVNQRLLFSGLEVREDGRVGRTDKAETLSEAHDRASRLSSELRRRDVHPDVLYFCRPELLQENYFHAVLEATKSVAEKLRLRTGSSLDGAALVDATCSINSGPLVMFNPLKNETERSEQVGLSTLIKGLFSAFRNPTAHAPKVLWATSEHEALDALTLASMLHRRLDQASLRSVS